MAAEDPILLPLTFAVGTDTLAPVLAGGQVLVSLIGTRGGEAWHVDAHHGRSSSVAHAAQRMIEAVDGPGVEVTMRVTLEQEAPAGVPDGFFPGRQAMWEARAAFIDAAQLLVGARLRDTPRDES